MTFLIATITFYVGVYVGQKYPDQVKSLYSTVSTYVKNKYSQLRGK